MGILPMSSMTFQVLHPEKTTTWKVVGRMAWKVHATTVT
jgi:hypothetical protein